MYQNHWERYHKAVCSINFYGKTNSKILGLTGFRVGRLIITDDLIYSQPDLLQVKIRFYEHDGVRIFKEITFSHDEFKSILPHKSSFDNLGLAFFNLDEKILEGTTEFALCPNCNSPIGKDALTISYQSDYDNIALRSALISSNYVNDRGLTFLQFDGTVRPATSGSPLIDHESGKVIGIVSNKEMKIVRTYHELLRTVDANLEILKKVKDKFFIEEVDPVQVLIVNQNQIKHLSKEIFLNFAMKNGYALDVNHLREQLENTFEADFD